MSLLSSLKKALATPLSLTLRCLLATLFSLAVVLGMAEWYVAHTYKESVLEGEYGMLHDLSLYLFTKLDISATGQPKPSPDWYHPSVSTLLSNNIGMVFPSDYSNQNLIIGIRVMTQDGKVLWSSSNESSGLIWDHILDSSFGSQLRGPVFVGTTQFYLLQSQFLRPTDSGTDTVEVRFMENKSLLSTRLRLWQERFLAGTLLVMVFVGVLQWFLLRVGLKPLSQFVAAVRQVPRGERPFPEGQPKELAPLAHCLNDFISMGQVQVERYRSTLSDLAHSLRTPLAVMRTRITTRPEGEGDPEVLAQVDRMEGIVQRNLARASSWRRLHREPVAVSPIVEQIVSGLEKLHADKRISCQVDIPESCIFFGEESDLFEVLGNLLDNAFKLGTSDVLVSASLSETASHKGLSLKVEDDGPGVNDEALTEILRRGFRLDETESGHGIGLATVRDIMTLYGGALDLGRAHLGGLAITAFFPDP